MIDRGNEGLVVWVKTNSGTNFHDTKSWKLCCMISGQLGVIQSAYELPQDSCHRKSQMLLRTIIQISLQTKKSAQKKSLLLKLITPLMTVL